MCQVVHLTKIYEHPENIAQDNHSSESKINDELINLINKPLMKM